MRLIFPINVQLYHNMTILNSSFYKRPILHARYLHCSTRIANQEDKVVRLSPPNRGSTENSAIATNISSTMNEIEKDLSLSSKLKLDNKLKKLNQSINNAQMKIQSHPYNTENNSSKADTTLEDQESSAGVRTSPVGIESWIQMETFFDSYKVVQQFKESGFTHEESLLLMRYTYFKLQEKFQWLNENYSPRVDLENEAYLFEAAHSELLFEVTNSREISLMNLTNAMIILKRGFNNLEDETLAQIKLNDDLIKMEINQFKHENNLHQKSLNLKNSDLNSRILSDMVSGLKSEIETYRWQLTRAGILSIVVMVVFIMGGWNLTRKLAAVDETENDSFRGPLLLPLHDQTDEESHDYEADWDERVKIA